MKNLMQTRRLGQRLGTIALVSAGAMLAVPLVAQTRPAGNSQAAAPAAQAATHTFRMANARVLPADTPRERLVAIMQGWSRALGVECSFCHAPYAASAPMTPNRPRLDFASDANPHKEVARGMVRMLQSINSTYFASAAGRAGPPPVTCFTCHRGSEHPANVPPAEPASPASPPPAHQAPPTSSSPH